MELGRIVSVCLLEGGLHLSRLFVLIYRTMRALPVESSFAKQQIQFLLALVSVQIFLPSYLQVGPDGLTLLTCLSLEELEDLVVYHCLNNLIIGAFINLFNQTLIIWWVLICKFVTSQIKAG